MGLGFWTVALVVMVPAAFAASWFDHTQRRIPNWLNAALAASGFIAQAVYFGWGGVGRGMLGLLVGLGLLLLPWLIQAVGAGDVKLMAAIGVWFGPWMILVAAVVGGILGGVLAALMIAASGRLAKAWSNVGLIAIKLSSRELRRSEFASTGSFGPSGQMVPYGVPLSVGALLVLSGRVFEWWMV